MLYVLTESELSALREIGKEHKAALQKACTLAAKHTPVQAPWQDHPSPWGCILDTGHGYCDECPVRDICPHEDKRWSK